MIVELRAGDPAYGVPSTTVFGIAPLFFEPKASIGTFKQVDTAPVPGRIDRLYDLVGMCHDNSPDGGAISL